MPKDQHTILMTGDTVGGVWTYCIDLISTLASSNCYFHLVTAGAPLNASQRDQLASLDNVTLHETNRKLEWMDDPWQDIDTSGRHLLELESKIKPDLVHLNCYAHAALPFRAPVVAVAHSDVFSWYYAVKKTSPGAEWQEYFQRVRNGIRNADYLVAPSHDMLRHLRSAFHATADSRIIYNGRDESNFRSTPKHPLIFTAGRLWDEGKNVRLLIAAAPYIEGQLRVAGEWNDHTTLPYNITHLGRIDAKSIANELAEAMLFVSPAKYEPFGLSILEAALSGCALVLGDIPSLREIWEDNAIYVDPADPFALANTCNKLLRNAEVAREFGARAKKRAALFSLRAMGKNYAHLYQQVIRSGKDIKMQIA